MDTNQKHIIDDYLAGRLDANSAAEFESNIASDAHLKSEFEFQKQIVEGIKIYRKQQLKSQLSELTVSPYGGIVYSTVGKIAAGLVVSVMVGSGVYFLIGDDDQVTEKMTVSEEIVIDAPLPEVAEINQLDLGAEESEELKDNPTASKLVAINVDDNIKTDLEEIGTERSAEAEDLRDESANTERVTSKRETFTPSIILPEDVSDIETEEGIVIEPISKDLFEKPELATEEQVKIEVESSQSNVFAYKYFDSKLTLIGEFDEGPYQILEVIGQGQKDIFLFYADQYYEIGLTSEAKPLEKITNEEKIRELDILKNYK